MKFEQCRVLELSGRDVKRSQVLEIRERFKYFVGHLLVAI